jgi:hypothetical protein
MARLRLGVIVAKMLQSLPELKRDGDTILGTTLTDLLYDDSACLKASTLLRQMETLPMLADKLKNEPSEVVQALEKLRSICES